SIYGSPHFWLPFHADPDTRFTSYALGPDVVNFDRPVYLLVDESQWIADLTSSAASAAVRAWPRLIARSCAVDAIALGTAYGTIALYRCDSAFPPHPQTPRIVGDGTSYRIGELVSDFTPA